MEEDTRGLRAGTPCPLALQRNTSAGLGAASGLAGNGSRDKAQPRAWLCPQPLRAREEGEPSLPGAAPNFRALGPAMAGGCCCPGSLAAAGCSERRAAPCSQTGRGKALGQH